LIETINRLLPIGHRVLALRKRMLGLDDLHLYDMYIPLSSTPMPAISYDQAREIVLEALAPLGAAYGAALRHGLYEGRWVDVYETVHKRSGAYSWGAYGTQPFEALVADPAAA
jgi:oligoendopeptidase F